MIYKTCTEHFFAQCLPVFKIEILFTKVGLGFLVDDSNHGVRIFYISFLLCAVESGEVRSSEYLSVSPNVRYTFSGGII
ncbi:CLUMA_CG000299, isoform A [Clunio marinus]|uniref:CLUMA_CG000299, isoform A n=1 Tax=Clunio marinus TaxID=568069 RepID=A0A1J1HEJ4_9DIPT|nr:CLUMA_CG000299, isoform A [Clunio marinus]